MQSFQFLKAFFFLRDCLCHIVVSIRSRCALGFEGKSKTVCVVGYGEGGHAELLEQFSEDASLFCLLRLTDGDRESQRIKFVLITFVGEAVNGLARARAGTSMSDVKPIFGVRLVFHAISESG
jgi:hypothetical protein